MSHICIHATISGKVQGVFYRHHTRRKAQELGITGWVKNLANGDVELIACGDSEAIKQLTTWLWDGPSRAKVDNVVCEEIVNEVHEDFKIM
jgi:acylphosphatase